MKRRAKVRIGILFTLAFASITVVVAVAVAIAVEQAEPPEEPEVAEAPANLLVAPLLPLDPAYEDAATALRERDCAAARSLLPAPSEGAPTDAALTSSPRFPLLVDGLYAHACEDLAGAVTSLEAAANHGGPLEDWRLLTLADSARALGREDLAEEALARLLSDHRDSILWERALLEAVEEAAHPDGLVAMALPVEDYRHLFQLVSWSREQDDLAPETISRIEQQAWELATARRDLTAQVAAARRLLIHAPLTASKLQVAELFRRADGSIPWHRILDSHQLVRRAESLLESQLTGAALATLAEVPQAERGSAWSVLQARALTTDGRPREALTLLDGVGDAFGADAARVAWESSRATASLASALAGGSSLSPAERAEMRDAERRHLATVVRVDADRRLSVAALERLFTDYAERQAFDRATTTLRLLRRADDTDTTGVSYLWNLGWTEYQRRNYTGAIGYWTELAEIYPETRSARAGRYWSGRAFELLGDGARARDVYQEIVGGPNDFYRKHAAARLDSRAAVGAEGDLPPPAPWPLDNALARARLLSDLGLESLAETEMAAVVARRGERVDQRAKDALRALILARQGQRRASIRPLRAAFPALGGPYQATVPLAAQRLYYPVEFEESVLASSHRAGLPPHLVFGVIREESAFDITARSHVGATGLMQVMPATGKEVAGRLGLPFSRERLDDPEYNVRLGTTYLAQVLDMFDGTEELALAGYNGGPYRMKRLWREAQEQGGSGDRAEMDYFIESLPVPESREYAKRVLLFAGNYRDLYGL